MTGERNRTRAYWGPGPDEWMEYPTFLAEIEGVPTALFDVLMVASMGEEYAPHRHIELDDGRKAFLSAARDLFAKKSTEETA